MQKAQLCVMVGLVHKAQLTSLHPKLANEDRREAVLMDISVPESNQVHELHRVEACLLITAVFISLTMNAYLRRQSG